MWLVVGINDVSILECVSPMSSVLSILEFSFPGTEHFPDSKDLSCNSDLLHRFTLLEEQWIKLVISSVLLELSPQVHSFSSASYVFNLR